MPRISDAAQRVQIAFHRFGLGAKPGGPARIGASPISALRAELRTAGIERIRDTTLPTYAEACALSVGGNPERCHEMRKREIVARFNKHLEPEIGFVERLVLFWSNHFTISGRTPVIRATLGQWERDVIRRNVLGKFSDMLLETTRHPGMIIYLDNDKSIGPGSLYGYTRRVSYTENLAREILDLHTVGSGNYDEPSVAALAKMLTGWTFVTKRDAELGLNGGSQANKGQFIFNPNWHERGPILFMGETFPEGGVTQAQDALLKLAALPATAEKIAFKLVRHFISDEPTPEMTDPIKQTFLQTQGNLRAVAMALLDLPQAWDTPLDKIRTPYELAVAQYRAVGLRLTDEQYHTQVEKVITVLNHDVWEALSPEGYSDETLHWLNPDGMVQRLASAQRLAAKIYGPALSVAPQVLAASIFGKALTRGTRERVAAGGEVEDALTILFASPEFQRR
jgi:uncharacterized protein (DUF1800 family)